MWKDVFDVMPKYKINQMSFPTNRPKADLLQAFNSMNK